MSSEKDVKRMNKLIVKLPLPISKNKRKEPVTYYDKKRKKMVCHMLVSDEVKLFFYNVRTIIKRQMPQSLFTDKLETRLSFDWYIKNLRSDTINYHPDLSDSIQKAIGVDDRYFLLHDRSRTIVKEAPFVIVEITQTGEKIKRE
jgi:hypothetical protein